MQLPYGRWLINAAWLGLFVFLLYARWVDSSIIHEYFISPFPTAASITYAVVFFWDGLWGIKRFVLSDAIDDRIFGVFWTALLFYGCVFSLWNLK